MPSTRPLPAALLALALATQALTAPAAHAQANAGASTAASSVLSAVPVASVAAASLGALALGGTFTVIAVSRVAEGSVWVLERASDGVRIVVTCASAAAGTAALAVGASVVGTAVAGGWILSEAGRLIAFVPNEIGRALLHSQRITP